MIGLLVNAAIAAAMTYWFSTGEELTVAAQAVIFIVLLNGFELGRLHRKINQLKK